MSWRGVTEARVKLVQRVEQGRFAVTQLTAMEVEAPATTPIYECS